MNGHYEYDSSGADDDAINPEDLLHLLSGLLSPDAPDSVTTSRNRSAAVQLEDMRAIIEGDIESGDIPVKGITADVVMLCMALDVAPDIVSDSKFIEFAVFLLSTGMLWAAPGSESLACKIHKAIRVGDIELPAVRVDEYPVPDFDGLDNNGSPASASLESLLDIPNDIGLPESVRDTMARLESSPDSLSQYDGELLLQWLADTRLVWRDTRDISHVYVHTIGSGMDQGVLDYSNITVDEASEFSYHPVDDLE